MEEQKIKCNRCKVNLPSEHFNKKRCGSYMKQCIMCNEKQLTYAKNNLQCEHNKKRYRCVECGGSEICEHQKQRYFCKDCKGGAFCKHDRRRSECRECDGEPKKIFKGCIMIKESKKTVVFVYMVNGQRKEKEFRYAKCGLDAAMQKAKDFQAEIFK